MPPRAGRRIPVALTIAGSDPSGGAGIQADLKTFCAFGVYGEAVVTSLTVQNTSGVRGVHPVPPEFVVRQIAAVREDIPPGGVKTGMLATAAVVRAVVGALRGRPRAPIVVDPVLVSSSGHLLLERDAVEAVTSLLLPLAAVVTPNGPEAKVLTGIAVVDRESALEAGRRLLAMGAGAALVKGGHGRGATVLDLLVERDRATDFVHRRIATTSTHGTGCTLSAAVAAGLARGRPLRRAAEDAVDFVHRAILRAPRLGRGRNRPVNHLVPGVLR